MKESDRLFVGREKEITEFRNLLNNPQSDSGIFFISGAGGIGKTWLIKRCLEIANEAQYKESVQVIINPVDINTTRTHHLEGLLEEIKSYLCEANREMEFSFPNYNSTKNALERARQLKDYSAQGVQRQLEELPKSFHQDLKEIGLKKKVVLALDTFELIQNTLLGEWVLNKEGLAIPGVILIIGSRLPRQSRKQSKLAGLTNKEALYFYFAYLEVNEPISNELKRYIGRLNQLANGNPLLLGLALVMRQIGSWNEDELRHLYKLPEDKRNEEFKRLIISGLDPAAGENERWIGNMHLDDARYKLLLYMAYLHPRFNRFFYRN